MNESVQGILTRHSVRTFAPREVDAHLIETILRCGMQAPSAGNEQPWEFLVVKNRETLARIPTFQPYTQMLLQAPVAILICGDLKREVYEGFWVQDCSAATQNMLLAAHALGLGAVWLGIHPAADRVAGHRELFKLPKNIVPFGMIALGYPKHQTQATPRFDPSRVHQESW